MMPSTTAIRHGDRGIGGQAPADWLGRDTPEHRSAAERCVNKWKQYRAVATRYDKRDYIFNGTLTVTAVII